MSPEQEQQNMPNDAKEMSRALFDSVRSRVDAMLGAIGIDEKDAWTAANFNLLRSFAQACMLYMLSDSERKEELDKERMPLSFERVIELAITAAPLPQETKEKLIALAKSLSGDDSRNPTRAVSKLQLLASESAASQLKQVILHSFKNNPVANQAYARLIL